MKLDDILNEKIKKVHGKWALVSKSDPDKVLQYYHGKDHPSKEWEKKVERRIHAFSHMNEADINKTIDDIRQNVHADELEPLKRYSNAQLADWLKRLTAKNKSVIGPAMATADALGPMAKPFAKAFVQRQYPTVDDSEFDQMWGVWNRMDDETRSAIKAGDLSTIDPRDEHGFVKETDNDNKDQSIAQQINFGGAYDSNSWLDTVRGWIGTDGKDQKPSYSTQTPQLQPKRVREANDYDAWLEKAKKRAEKQAAKKRAELQQVMKGIETDPEKLALQGTIQAARGELSKRKREALAKMEQMKQVYSEFSDEDLDKIIGRYSKGPGAGSDFVEWLRSIKQDREDERSGVQQRQDVFRSVAGPMQGKQSQRAAPAQDKPWTQLGMSRDEYRRILNNPQHPRHREIKQLHDQYKQVDEDLTRRDFLKGVAGGAMALGAMKAANALGFKDPTRSTDTDDQYQRFTGAKPAPLYAKPDLDPERKWNRVGVNQPGGQFSIVLHKDFDLYLYFVTRDYSTSPYAYIELQDGEKYKFRIRTLKNDTFTIEDPRMAATLLNYQGKFNLYVGNDVYTFNITPSQESKVLYRWWKEGTHQGL